MGALGSPRLLFQSLSDYIFNILQLISKDERHGEEVEPASTGLGLQG